MKSAVLKQLCFTVFIFLCAVIIFILHLYGNSAEIVQDIPPITSAMSRTAVISPDGNTCFSYTPTSAGIRRVQFQNGLWQIPYNSLGVTVFAFIILGLFIKHEKYRTEFIFDSDGKK